MVIFEEYKNIANNEYLNDIRNKSAIVLGAQLMSAAISSRKFTAVLLNQEQYINDCLKKGLATSDLSNESGSSCSIIDYLNELDSQNINNLMTSVKTHYGDHWLCDQILLECIIKIIFDICHIENMLIRYNKFNLSQSKINKYLSSSLGVDFSLLIFYLGSILNIKLIEPSWSKALINFNHGLDLVDTLLLGEEISSYQVKQLIQFVKIMNNILHEYNHLSTKNTAGDAASSAVDLYFFPKKDKKQEIGSFVLPDLIKGKPEISLLAHGVHAIIDLTELNVNNKKDFKKAVSATLSKHCSCRQDTKCGCTQLKYEVDLLGDQYGLLKVIAYARHELAVVEI